MDPRRTTRSHRGAKCRRPFFLARSLDEPTRVSSLSLQAIAAKVMDGGFLPECMRGTASFATRCGGGYNTTRDAQSGAARGVCLPSRRSALLPSKPRKRKESKPTPTTGAARSMRTCARSTGATSNGSILTHSSALHSVPLGDLRLAPTHAQGKERGDRSG